MGRKVGWALALVVTAVVSAGLVGGQVGGFLWWGTHEPIYIFGDEDFTYANGVMSGSGTQTDPYVIEGWSIAPANADYGFYIDHTTKHFVIRDCVVEGARVAGVYLNSVENGRIEEIQVRRSDTAVFLLNSRMNRVADSVIAECRYGVMMAALSQGNVVTGNSFLDNGLAGYDPQGWNTWYEGKSGNYWSDYDGADANKDGIGDEPYYPLDDAKPLMAAPAELTSVQPAGPSYAGNLVAPDGSLVVTSQTPITLTAADLGSGLAEIKYSIDNGAWTTYSSPILLKGDDGVRKITYYGIDKLGNAEAKRTVSFLLDNHAPQTAIEIGDPKYTDSRGTWITSSSLITLRRAQESTYGRAETYYRINDGGWLRYSVPFRITGEDGARSISYYSKNASGVVEAVQTKVLLKDDAPPASRGATTGTPTGATTGTSSATTAATSTTKPASTTPAVTAPTTATTTTKPAASTATTAPATTKPATTPTVTTPSTTSTASTTSVPAATTGSKDGTTQAELSGTALGQTPATPTQTASATVAPSTATPSTAMPSTATPSTTQTPSTTVPATPTSPTTTPSSSSTKPASD